jgi:hypothetical protein
MKKIITGLSLLIGLSLFAQDARVATGIQEKTIRYAFDKCESEVCLENFVTAGKVIRGGTGKTRGAMPFDDTDVYKTIEGAALSRITVSAHTSSSTSANSWIANRIFPAISAAATWKECKINYVCKVVKTVEINYCYMFFGEIKETYIDKNCLEGDTPDIIKIDPLLASIDGKFWTINELNK